MQINELYHKEMEKEKGGTARINAMQQTYRLSTPTQPSTTTGMV